MESLCFRPSDAAQDSAQPHLHIQARSNGTAVFEWHYVPRSYELVRFMNVPQCKCSHKNQARIQL